MILERFPEIQKLTQEELTQLRGELDDLLVGPVDDVVNDPAILALLEHRHAEYLRDPSTARPAEEVLARLRAKYIDRHE
jgi:hypothetical protein